MQDRDFITPGCDPKDRTAGRTRFLAAGGAAAAGLAVALAGAGGHFNLVPFGASDAAEAATAGDGGRQTEIAEMTVDDKSQIIVEGADAQKRNAELPVSGLPVERVESFSLAHAAKRTEATAQRCMAQAVYYEAANEPIEGRRAVAQVVLNRLRHPEYPKSVCGVVYEGSERRTGCQFSFTCDGSLLRRPAAGAWREAEVIARDALSGHVEKSVGTATHYHADYVLPKWAFTLGKIEQLGHHIFYRFKGRAGRSAAFNGRYSGIERIPAIDFAALRARLEADGEQIAENFVPGLTVTPHVTDRHAENDVGGRIDTTKQWRLTIPDPVQASSRYREAVQESVRQDPAASHVAIAESGKQIIVR